jgi:hypothetical protein
MAQVGNKQNAYLNGFWAAHARKKAGEKRHTSKARRRDGKAIVRNWTDWKQKNKGR